MSGAYLDASVLLPTIIEEAGSAAVDAFIGAEPEPLLVSEFAVAEVASALSRLVRTGVLDVTDARERLADFDTWRAGDAQLVDVEGSDTRLAGVLVRRFELMLRAPDALHLAMARRLGARLVTMDRRMAIAGRDLELDVVLLEA